MCRSMVDLPWGVWGKNEVGFEKREEHMPKRDGQKRDADVLLRVVIALRPIKAERDLSDRAMAMQANVSWASPFKTS